MMAQNDQAGEYINSKKAHFCLDNDSSESHCYSDSNGDSNSGWLRFNLWLGFVMAQNDQAGEYNNLTKAYFCADSNNSDSEIYSDSDAEGDSYIGWLRWLTSD